MERPARRRAWSCSSKAPRAAAGVHVVHGTLLESCWGGEVWWRGCWGHRRLQECQRRREALVPSARCGGERAAGRRLRTTARGPSTRAALHALFGSFTSRAYLLVGLQQSDSPTSKSGFLCGAASLATGKLEDCAAHQAARSAAWRGAASRSLRKLDEAHLAVGGREHTLSPLSSCQSSKRLRINSSPTGRRSSAPGIRIDIGKRPPSPQC